jgi:hypothetical protein
MRAQQAKTLPMLEGENRPLTELLTKLELDMAILEEGLLRN